MSDFMDDAKNLADKDPGMADKGLNEAEQEADSKTGGKFDSEIQKGDQQAENFLGTDQQGNQNQ